MKKRQRLYTEETFALVGICSFPFLAKTAKDEPGKFAEDKYKVAISIEQKAFHETELCKEVEKFIAGWYPDAEKLSVIDGLAGIKDLNDGLEKSDKYYDLKHDRYQINAKRNPNSKKNVNQPAPLIYDEAGDQVTEEADILRIQNGCKICIVVRPVCYGDYEEYAKYNKGLDKCGDDVNKIKTYIAKTEKPIFGITLELFQVQLLEARKGGAPNAASLKSHVVMNTEVPADDLDIEPEEEEEIVEQDDCSDEEVDL